MTNPVPNSAVAKPANAVETREIVLKEISAKWGKFSEQDLSALKDKDDVVAQIVTKYGYDKQQVQRDVDSLMKGRRI
jgi:division protein CdvB (Snf7/Vps24/ESCRT-III family)